MHPDDGIEPDTGFKLEPRKRKLPSTEPKDIPDYLLDDGREYTLYVRDHVMIGVREYACQDPENEVGGVLLGAHYQKDERTVVVVKDYLPLRSESTSRTHFDFDSLALLDLHRQQRSTPDSYVVGWFHSHVRIGDPFMSSFDLNLHRSYFKEPWYVSCVVGGGEWTLPVGFWRMKGEDLIYIPEHYLHMTHAEPLGEQTRRYFRACVGEERPLNKLISRIASLRSLNPDQIGSLSRVFEPALIDEATRPTRSEVLGPVLSLIDLALTMTEEPEKIAEVKALASQLRRMRFIDDSFVRVLSSEGLRERIAVHGNRALSLTPGGEEIACSDFVANIIWTIVLDPSITLVDLSFAYDGKLWALTSHNNLIQISELTEADPLIGGPTSQKVKYVSFQLPQLDTDVQEVSATTREVWVRTRGHAFRLTPGEDEARQLELTLADVVKLEEGSVFIRGMGQDEGFALTASSGTLRMINSKSQELCKVDLGVSWSKWSLKSACSCSVGILVLFDDGVADQLALFEKDSLALIHHYVDSRSKGERRMGSVTVDESQRAFVKRGISVSLLTESGAPNPHWYHFRSGGKRRPSPMELRLYEE